MNRLSAFVLVAFGIFANGLFADETIRIGIIGLDTSHTTAFTRILNDPNAAPEVAGCRVVCAYPKGSADIETSTSRVPKYTKDIQQLGVEIVDSIDALLERVAQTLEPTLAQSAPDPLPLEVRAN